MIRPLVATGFLLRNCATRGVRGFWRRMIIRRVVAVALLVLASPAAATVLVPMPDTALVGTSQLVVLGTVERVEVHETADGRIVTEATVALERV